MSSSKQSKHWQDVNVYDSDSMSMDGLYILLVLKLPNACCSKWVSLSFRDPTITFWSTYIMIRHLSQNWSCQAGWTHSFRQVCLWRQHCISKWRTLESPTQGMTKGDDEKKSGYWHVFLNIRLPVLHSIDRCLCKSLADLVKSCSLWWIKSKDLLTFMIWHSDGH